MTEKKLDFNALEARGIYMLQQSVLQAAAQAEQAAAALREAEADAAAVLAGRVPEGVTIRSLRIDQQTSAVFAPEAPKG